MCWAHPQFSSCYVFLLYISRSHRTSLLTNQARSATGNLLSHLTGIINSIPSQISLSSQQQQSSNDVPSSQVNHSNNINNISSSLTTPVIIEATTEPSHVTLANNNHHLHHVHVLSSAAIEINSPSTMAVDSEHQSKIQIGDVKLHDDVRESKAAQNHHDNNGLITIVTINNRHSDNDNVNSIVWNQKKKKLDTWEKQNVGKCVIKYSTNPLSPNSLWLFGYHKCVENQFQWKNFVIIVPHVLFCWQSNFICKKVFSHKNSFSPK